MLFLYAMELLTDEKELAQFEQIMNKYRRMMYNSAYGFLLDPTAAEDAVTDAFMGVLRNFDGVKGLDNRELQNYLYKAARNAAISINRKRERLARHEVPLEEYKSYSDIFAEDLYDEISLETCIRKRISKGSTGYDSVEEQIKYVEEKL